MIKHNKKSIIFSGFLFFTLMFGSLAVAAISPGQTAPEFTLNDHTGKSYALTDTKSRAMVILYFFDINSRPSQEGMLNLSHLWKKYAESDMLIWGITRADNSQIAEFVERAKPGIPILLDDGKIHDLFQARSLLPTVCILGSDLKVKDVFQGGGKATEVMLVRVAERTYRKQPLIAKALSEDVIKQNPQNAEARSLQGHDALKNGNTQDAEKIFTHLAQEKGQAEILGKEGLSAVYAQQGQTKKALELATEVEQKAPDRALPHVIKGDLFASQGRKEEATREYRQAVAKDQPQPLTQSLAYNRLGRTYADQGEYTEARKLYDNAVEIDPFYVEATSNKGVAFEKEGRWDEALQSYQTALRYDQNDPFSRVLAQKAEEMLKLQQDTARSERIDQYVKELSERFRQQDNKPVSPEQSWTSRPMVLSFVDFQEKGLTERDGTSLVITTQLAEKLNASGRVKVVDRVLIERLLEELNLGSSALADPQTALQLGRVLAAQVLGTGTILFSPDATLLSLRLINTETTAVAKVFTQPLGRSQNWENDINLLNRDILRTIIQKFPLQGFIVTAANDQFMINLGSDQGVVLGTEFDAIEEPESIEYQGKILQGSPKTIAKLEVTAVEKGLSYVRVISQQRPLHKDDKIRESLPTLTQGSDSAKL